MKPHRAPPSGHRTVQNKLLGDEVDLTRFLLAHS